MHWIVSGLSKSRRSGRPGRLGARKWLPVIGACAALAAAAAVALPAPATQSSAAPGAAQRKQAAALFSSAFRLWQSGDFDSAEIGFAQGLQLDPANGPANFYYGDILSRRDDARAADYMRRAARLAPTAPEGLKAQAFLAKDQRAQSEASAAAAAQSERAKAAKTWLIGFWNMDLHCTGGSHVWKVGFLDLDGEQLKMSGGSFKSAEIDGLRLRIHWHSLLHTTEMSGDIQNETTIVGVEDPGDSEHCRWTAHKLATP